MTDFMKIQAHKTGFSIQENGQFHAFGTLQKALTFVRKNLEFPNRSSGLMGVRLLSYGDKKIQVIKEVRAISGLSLKESKDLVERCDFGEEPFIGRFSDNVALAFNRAIEEVGGQACLTEVDE